MDLGHGDDLDEGVGHAVEIEELGRGWVFLRFGRILFQLNLLDIYADFLSIFRGNAVVIVEVDVAISREWLCIAD